jgi:hypothetical protein
MEELYARATEAESRMRLLRLQTRFSYNRYACASPEENVVKIKL